MKNSGYIIIGGLAVTALVLTVIVVRKRNSGPVKKDSGNDFLKPVVGRLSSGFGSRTDPTRPAVKQVHNGQDIAVPTGTPVKATADADVISTTSTEEGGNQVILKHDAPRIKGFQSGYAHLSKVLVNRGQHVKKGDVIALSGSTGKHTTGPHVHFTVTNPMGQKVDPKPLVYAV